MNSLRRYLVSVALMLVLLVCAAAALLAYQVDRFGRAQSERQLLQTTRALSLVVDEELERYQAILGTLRASETLLRRDWRSFDRQARSALSDPAAWIVVGDRSGRQLVNTRLPAGAALPQASYPSSIWRTLDAGQGRICNLSRGIVERNILCVDLPIIEDGRAAYVLSVIMRPEQLRSVVERQRLQPGSFATVLDRKGIVIWRNTGADRFVGRAGTPDVLEALARRSEGVKESRSLEGVPTVVAYSRSPVSGWTFVVALPRAKLRAGTNRAFALAAGGALALILLSAAVGLAAARRISGAVEGLSRVTGQMQSGGSPHYEASGLAEIDAAGAALARAIAERNKGEQYQRLLINELNHRVKNTLAVVQSIAQQTLRSGGAEPALIAALESRLAALAAAHDVLTRENWTSASMREIIGNALLPFCPDHRCEVDGPDLRLSPRTAVSLALAIHELATNASKYGALANGTGSISVLWSADDDRLKLSWREQGGPEVVAPARRGFGSRILERSLAGELGGTALLTFDARGVRYEVDAPLPRPE